MYVFLNNEIISDEKPYIYIKDRGFLLGDGIFETIKVQNGQIVFFDEHYRRLENSAKFLSIPMPYSQSSLKESCTTLIKKNNLYDSSAAMRITLTRGIGLRGINIPNEQNPTLLITVTNFNLQNTHYPTAMITSIKRNQYSPIIQHKTLNYLEPILARKEANESGFEEGIMLNTDGFITESSIANIFFVKNATVITPSINSGILPGIVREQIIKLCKKNKIPIIEKNISPSDIPDMDEAFQTNSLVGVQPLSAIDDKIFLVDSFSITQKISKLYETETDKNIKF